MTHLILIFLVLHIIRLNLIFFSFSGLPLFPIFLLLNYFSVDVPDGATGLYKTIRFYLFFAFLTLSFFPRTLWALCDRRHFSFSFVASVCLFLFLYWKGHFFYSYEPVFCFHTSVMCIIRFLYLHLFCFIVQNGTFSLFDLKLNKVSNFSIFEVNENYFMIYAKTKYNAIIFRKLNAQCTNL